MNGEEERPRTRGLGRGLSALLGEGEAVEATRGDEATAGPEGGRAGVRMLPVDLLTPNPDQPRKTFSEPELAELADSIAAKGVLQPLLVRPLEGPEERYQIVAGERRWRAAQRAKVHEAPCVIREFTDREVLEIGLVENIQRADLNPLEEAQALRQLVDAFGHTQEEVARAVGKSRAHVANMLRLLDLPDSVRDRLAAGDISAGHARAIASTPDPAALVARIIEGGLSVRSAEALAREAAVDRAPRGRPRRNEREKDVDASALEAGLSERLGLGVEIRHSASGEAGEIRVRYSTLEQLDEVCRRLSQNT